LFDNIKPLFANKPLMVIANKKDVWGDNLTEEKKALVASFEDELVIRLKDII
jgi:GTP1/Obg family GTP-binding protein